MEQPILIVAGEASGDLHGGNLVRALRTLRPDLRFFGIGGEQMRAAGVELLYHVDELAFLGFTEVVRHLPYIWGVMRHVTRAVEERRPRLAILIDYPGFNLRLAPRLRGRGARVFYYIAPQVWAWGEGRVRKMARLVDRLAVILPFEEKIFRDAGVDAHFVGHPIVELARDETPREEFLRELGLDEGVRLVGLFPGSREQEVKRHLPEMGRLIEALHGDDPHLAGVVSRAPTVDRGVYDQILDQHRGAGLRLTSAHYALMHHADVLVVASGTATLEAACIGTPYVIVYRVSPLTYALGKRLVRLPYIGLVNVVAGRRIVPEFLQRDFRAEKLKPVVQALLRDEDLRRQMRANLMEVRRSLGMPGAPRRAAELALDLLETSSRSLRAESS